MHVPASDLVRTLRLPAVAAPGLLGRGLRAAQALSLDVVLGVLCAAAFASTACGARPPFAWWVLLPAVTWAVYTADHLLDAVRLGRGAHTARHRLHARHFAKIAAHGSAVAGVAVVAALLSLPPGVRVAAAACGVAAAVHLGMAAARVRWWPKELTAAAIYAAGIWFAPWIGSPARGAALAAVLGLHLLAAFANLVLFAWIDLPTDRLDGHPSLARRLGARRTRNLVIALGAAGGVAATVGALAGPSPAVRGAFAALAPLLVATAVLAWRPPARPGVARTVGDLSFLVLALPWLAGLAS